MCSMSMDFKHKHLQDLKQLQRLIMSPQMQQAIHLMQLPAMALALRIEREIQQNPLLEYDEPEGEESDETEQEQDSEKELEFRDNDFEILKRLDEDFKEHFDQSENYYLKRTQDEEKLKSFLEQSIQAKETLIEHLMRQSRQYFETDEQHAMAKIIICSLDDNGFLKTPLEEIAQLYHFHLSRLETVLRGIQTFDPFGVGAKDLRECLLIQMRCRGEKKSLAYKIVDQVFDHLLHNRLPLIKKEMRVPLEQVQEAIEKKIAKLDLHPGALFYPNVVQPIIPDVTVTKEDTQFNIVINQEDLPTIRLNTRYLAMLNDASLAKETKNFIRAKLMKAKWLLKNIDQRNTTLYRLVEALIAYQKDFFIKDNGTLRPLTMKEIAKKLALHESTIARAVSNKYIDTPRGIFSLRFFFSVKYQTLQGKAISAKTIKDILRELISSENKGRPYSDQALSEILERRGILCARRTVAKYRVEMRFGNANQRRKFTRV